jgi:hypothetical protein
MTILLLTMYHELQTGFNQSYRILCISTKCVYTWFYSHIVSHSLIFTPSPLLLLFPNPFSLINPILLLLMLFPNRFYPSLTSHIQSISLHVNWFLILLLIFTYFFLLPPTVYYSIPIAVFNWQKVVISESNRFEFRVQNLKNLCWSTDWALIFGWR